MDTTGIACGCFSIEELSGITSASARAFITCAMDKGYSIKTINHTITAVTDPSVGLSDIRLPESSWKPLTLEQVQSILDHMTNNTLDTLRNQLLVLLMVDTGARVSEIASIKTCDIDLAGSRIRVMGKGGRERYLSIVHKTVLHIAKYLRKIKELSPVYLFENSDYGKPLTRAAIGKIVRKAGEDAGIPGVHPHRLRHTFTSEYVAAGGDAFTLQRELGHSNIQMSQRYVTLYDSSVQRKHQDFSPASKLTMHRKH